MNRITKLYLKLFIYKHYKEIIISIGFSIIILSLVFWCVKNEREISDLRVEIKNINNTGLNQDEKQFVKDLKKERESVMKLPVIPGY